jgi:hypothetical protein
LLTSSRAKLDNLILQCDTVLVKESKTESNNHWQKTPVSNLVRYVASGILFARIRVQGKLIRRSLKTKVLSVAKLRLTDLAMKVYGHLRNQHSTSMAQKVAFSETPPTTIVSLPLQNNESSTAKPQKKTTAQAKAKYSYPWWASNEAIENFWGQANEPVQIVPSSKYLQSAKAAMGREVFEQELSEPQALLDELLERVGASTMEKLKAKISPSLKQQAA